MNKPDVLLLTAHGTAQLLDSHDAVLWSSDDDEQFTDEFTDEFLEEDDVPDILAYLVEVELIEEGTELDLRIDTLEMSDTVNLRDTRDL